MQSIKNFFALMWRSSTSPGAYRDFATRRFGQGVSYLYFLLVVTTLVTGAPSLGLVRGLQGEAGDIVESLKQGVQEFYPSELEVVLEKGELRANVAQPYDIPFPKKLKELIDADPPSDDIRFRNMKHLIEIDTNAQIDDYWERGAVFLVTKNSIIFPDKSKGLKARTFSAVDDFILNKGVYDSYVPTAIKWIDRIPWLISVGVPLLLLLWAFIWPCFSIIGYLGYLLLTSVFLLLFALVLRSTWSYGKIFSVSLYGLTLPIVISTAWGLCCSFPTFLFSIIFVGWMSVVMVRSSRAR
jgi:Protein of unknown function (DUF1189)